MSIRLAAAVVIGTVVLTVSAACTSAPTGGADPTSGSSGPSASSTSSAAPIKATGIVIAADRVSLVSASGTVLDSVSYSSGSRALVDLLTPLLGAARTTPAPADTECIVPFAVSSWGDSLGGSSLGQFEVRTPSTPLIPGVDTWVVARVERLNGISIRSSSGYGVGDSMAPVIAALDPQQLASINPSALEGGNGPGYVTDTGGTIDVDGAPVLYGVATAAQDDAVAIIGAPRTSFRQGC